MSALSSVSYVVEFNPWVPSGSGVVMSDAMRGFVVIYRHPSEWALHMASATWHPDGARCQTWTDSECRCMLGGEA